jgi:hypothetical protein
MNNSPREMPCLEATCSMRANTSLGKSTRANSLPSGRINTHVMIPARWWGRGTVALRALFFGCEAAAGLLPLLTDLSWLFIT